jgi:hypothetical protein
MSLNKQLIIHVATEIIIVGTVTVFLNKRITKVEKALLEQQYKNRELELRLQHIEQLLHSSPQPVRQRQQQPIHQQASSSQQQVPRKQQPPPQVFDIPMFSGVNPLQSIFSTMFEPKHTNTSFEKEKEKEQVNVEIMQEDPIIKEVNVTVTNEEEEKIVEEALQSILHEESEPELQSV